MHVAVSSDSVMLRLLVFFSQQAEVTMKTTVRNDCVGMNCHVFDALTQRNNGLIRTPITYITPKSLGCDWELSNAMSGSKLYSKF